MRRSVLLLLLLAAAPLPAGEVLFAGPETILGSTELVPWSGEVWGPPAVEVDGERTVVAWVGSHFGNAYRLYVNVLDRDGKPLSPLPRMMEQDLQLLSRVRIVRAGPDFLVFYVNHHLQLYALRVSRDGEVLGTRFLRTLEASTFDVAGNDDEIVLVLPSLVVRYRHDLTPIGEIRLPWTSNATGVAAGPDGFAILSAAAPAVLAQTLRGAVLGPPVRVGSAGGAEVADLVWAGSDYVAVWQDCSDRYCSSGWQVRSARLDVDLRMLGAAMPEQHAGCYLCAEPLHVTSAGDGTAFIAWGWEERTFAVPLRGGNEAPIELPGFVRVVVTPDKRTLGVSGALRLLAVPLDGNEPAEGTPVAFTARAERLGTAAMSSDALAVFHWNYGEPDRGAVFSLDGTQLHEMVVPEYTSQQGLATDGRDFYALMTGWQSYFQKLVPGAEPVLLSPFERGEALPVLTWTGSAFATVWKEPGPYYIAPPARVELIDTEGKFLESWCENNMVLPPQSVELELAAADGDLLLAVGGKVAHVENLSGDGCLEAPLQAEDLGVSPRFAWHRGTWAAVGTVAAPFQPLRLSLSRDGEPFRAASVVGRNVSHASLAVAGAGGHWIVLYSDVYANPELRALLLDEEGNEQFGVELASDAAHRNFLFPVSDNEVLAVYTRAVIEPPYLGVPRVVMRRLTFEPQTRRRGVRP